jgi:hypothetical protein
MFTLNKIIFPDNTKSIFFLIFPIFAALVYVDFQFTNIGFLQLHSIDDYVFHGSLNHMYTGVTEGSLKALFGYGFYQYGFIFFFINLLASAPAFAMENTPLTLAIPRIVTSLFAVASLGVIFAITRLYLEKIPSMLFVLFFVTMPAFWFNATWFHPDWPMTFFLLGFVYFLTKDNWAFKKNFYVAVLFYALAISFKYQAITFMPLLGLYIFYDSIKTLRIKNVSSEIIIFTKSLSAIITVFILTNPFILHPVGWKLFSGSFINNMKSNATNHGSAALVTLTDKITFAVGEYYMNGIFLFILISATAWLSVKYLQFEKKSIFSIVAINFLINFGYLLFFVNKAWQMYYLPVFTVGLLALIYFCMKLTLKMQIGAITLAIIIQILFFAPSYYPLLAQSQNSEAPDFNTYSQEENTDINTFILSSLKGNITPGDNILLNAYTPFEYEKLSLSFDDVRIIFGPISASTIDIDAYVTAQKTFWKDTKTATEIATSFRPIKYIILRKDNPVIDTTKIKNAGNADLYNEGAALVRKLYTGQLAYDVFTENEYIVIFKYKNN